MGSRKYGGYVAGTAAVSLLLEWAASAAFRAVLPSGPYGLIFANFVTFALAVPPLQKFTLFGRQLTDKACPACRFLSSLASCGVDLVIGLRMSLTAVPCSSERRDNRCPAASTQY